MDGFPRTQAQAEAVDRLLGARGRQVDRVVLIEVDEDELVQRMMGRAAQEGRSDDTPEAFRKRLAVYREQTEPLVSYYRSRGLVTAVPGVGTVDQITERIRRVLDR
jgi:adenylate kinase